MRPCRAAPVMAALAVLLTACQPAGGPAGDPADDDAAAPADEQLGAPDAGVATSLEELLTRGEMLASEWQSEPRLAEIGVELDEQGRWVEARLLYLAAGADRFLAVASSAGGLSQQRPTLGTLDVEPITAAGLAQLPPLPADVAGPSTLVAAAEEPLAECDVAVVRDVLYATGAPVAWDGGSWRQPPAWTATLLDPLGRGVVVDPATGEAAGDSCL